MPKAKKRIENSNTFDPVKLIPEDNCEGSLKKLPITIPSNKPIKMLFKKGIKALIIHAKVAIEPVNSIPNIEFLEIIYNYKTNSLTRIYIPMKRTNQPKPVFNLFPSIFLER